MAGVVTVYEVRWIDSRNSGREIFSKVAIGDTSVGAPTTFADIPRILQIKNGVAERDILIMSADIVSMENV